MQTIIPVLHATSSRHAAHYRSVILEKVTQLACGAADLSADRCKPPGRERPGGLHGHAHMPAVFAPHYVVAAGDPLQFPAALAQRLDDVLFPRAGPASGRAADRDGDLPCQLLRDRPGVEQCPDALAKIIECLG